MTSWFGYSRDKQNDGDSIAEEVDAAAEWEVLGREQEEGNRTTQGPRQRGREGAPTVVVEEDDFTDMEDEQDLGRKENTALKDLLRRQETDVKAAKEEHRKLVDGLHVELDLAKEKSEKRERDLKELEQELQNARAERCAEGDLKTLALEKAERMETMAEKLRAEVAQSNRQSDILQHQAKIREKRMQALQEDWQRLKDQHTQILALLGSRTLELRGAQTSLVRPDLVADQEIVSMIEELNSEILQLAAYMADSFQFQTLRSAHDDLIVSAWERTSELLGSRFVEIMTSTPHEFDPTLVQVALQGCMAASFKKIINSWCFDDSRCGQFLPDLYTRIRKAGE